ncbi:uncharacterized protein LOC141943628 isoform X2 [Strix uralensis]|uniref:uncharacterized protein LOC141943628 isoform X2 n=1 Tax=Strix uralensis TaxID=36305 RepID=UPI003DA6FC28
MVICYRLSSNHNSFWCPTWGMKFEIMAEREDAVITTKAVTLCESSEIIKQRSKGHNSKGAEGGVVQSLRSEGRRSAETAEELPGRAASPPASALTSCGEDAALPRPQEDAAGQGLPGTSRLALTGVPSPDSSLAEYYRVYRLPEPPTDTPLHVCVHTSHVHGNEPWLSPGRRS